MPDCVVSSSTQPRLGDSAGREGRVIRIGVLVSGRGSNLQSLLDAETAGSLHAEVGVVCSDRADAPALTHAEDRGKPALFIDPCSRRARLRPEAEQALVRTLSSYDIEWVVLAGFMRIVGSQLLEAFPNRVVNIHPSLLPSFPGLHPQRQALEAGVQFSGCTVHLVDSGVDSGPILAQRVVPVESRDTESDLAERILVQEHQILVETMDRIARVGFELDRDRVRWNDDV